MDRFFPKFFLHFFLSAPFGIENWKSNLLFKFATQLYSRFGYVGDATRRGIVSIEIYILLSPLIIHWWIIGKSMKKGSFNCHLLGRRWRFSAEAIQQCAKGERYEIIFKDWPAIVTRRWRLNLRQIVLSHRRPKRCRKLMNEPTEYRPTRSFDTRFQQMLHDRTIFDNSNNEILC